MSKLSAGVLGLGLGAAICALPAAAAPSNEELNKSVQQLSEQVRRLSEELAQQQKAPPAQDRWSNLHVGGYGELHYNSLQAEDDKNDKEEIDFHRFVLLFGYSFSERMRFASELELEHSFSRDTKDGSPGEVELEQAYLEFDLNPSWRARGGIILVPIGILNETHEPATFYGVERNDVENIIIPGTWWGGGASIGGKWSNGLSWDLMLHEGLNMPTTGSSAFRVRSGRQKTSEANASSLAGTTRLAYNGIPGLNLAASVHYESDASQDGFDGLEEGLLYSASAVVNQGPFGLRALYSRWEFEGAAIEAADVETQTGWYIEPSFKLNPKLGFYARYEDIDAARTADRFSQWEGGINYWPHPQVVLKADYRSREHDEVADEKKDFDGFDLGIGYHF